MAADAQLLELIPQLGQWAAAKKCVRRLWVYGSRVRGTQTLESDLDIALEIDPLGTDEDTQTTWISEKASWLRELQAISPFEIQVEWYGGVHTPQITQFLADCSMLVFEREA